MMILFLYGYILPMVVVLLYAILLDEKTNTIGDVLDVWWAYLIPMFNIFCLGLIIIVNIIEGIKSSNKLKHNRNKLKHNWNKLLRVKLPKIYDTKL